MAEEFNVFYRYCDPGYQVGLTKELPGEYVHCRKHRRWYAVIPGDLFRRITGHSVWDAVPASPERFPKVREGVVYSIFRRVQDFLPRFDCERCEPVSPVSPVSPAFLAPFHPEDVTVPYPRRKKDC